MNSKDSISIRPAGNILGSLRVPGDKSISHRYAMLAALAQGRSRFDNFAPGADCASTLGCVRELGCEVSSDDKGVVTIDGLGAQLEAPSKQLDCGNSGSTMRMLSGILAAQPFSSELIGDESLSRRPMKRIIEPLTQMGAKISAANGDRAPLRIDGGRAARHRVSAGGGERAGKDVSAVRRAARRGQNSGIRTGAHAGSRRTRAAGIRRGSGEDAALSFDSGRTDPETTRRHSFPAIFLRRRSFCVRLRFFRSRIWSSTVCC